MIKKIRKSSSHISRLLFVLIIIGGTFAFAMFQGGLVSWTIFYAVLPFNIYAILLFFYPLSRFQAERIVTAAQLQQGETLKVTVILTRKFPFPLLYTVLSDRWLLEERSESNVEMHKMIIWGWKKQVKWQYEVNTLSRGKYYAPCIRVEVTDFFGWIRKSRPLDCRHQVLVYPQTVDIVHMPGGVEQGGSYTASPFSFVKDTMVVTGVRNYKSGDRPSSIHWKSFARTQTLMTKELEDKSSEDMTLLLDGRMSTTFEAEITFVASILKEAMKERLPVRFIPLHRAMSFSMMQSEAQFKAALLYLGGIQPVREERIVWSDAMRREIAKSGRVVVITASPDEQLIDDIKLSSGQRQTIVCFVVVENQGALSKALLKDIAYAKSKGILVQPVMKKQFTNAFKEVI